MQKIFLSFLFIILVSSSAWADRIIPRFTCHRAYADRVLDVAINNGATENIRQVIEEGMAVGVCVAWTTNPRPQDVAEEYVYTSKKPYEYSISLIRLDIPSNWPAWMVIGTNIIERDNFNKLSQ